MLLSQNRDWRVTRGKLASQIAIGLELEELPEAWRELKDFRLAIPIDRWNRVESSKLREYEDDETIFEEASDENGRTASLDRWQ